MASKSKTKSNVKTSFTNTKKEKITILKSGEKFRNGVSEGGGSQPGYRTVTGKNSGRDLQVKIGSGADSQYNQEGLYMGKGADTAKFSSENVPIRKPIGMITSQQGKGIVSKADQKINNLSPITATPTAPTSEGGTATTQTTTPTTTQTTPTTPAETTNDYITYLNQNTGQEMTLKGNAITDQAKADAEKQGYTVASSEISGVKTTPEMARIQSELDSATRETNSFMSRLESMLITDKELASETRQIRSKYNARQNEMAEINKRRQVAMETLGVRTGMRYTGGIGGIMGGILSEEERQGLMRIEQIENDKQDAILNAKKAARDQNFSLYAKLADKAEKMQEKKAAELQALKKAQAEQDLKIQEETRKSLVGAVVSDLINKGVTSNNEIYSKLTDPTISSVIGNVAPEDFKKLMDALLPTGTGIIGEYEYYKREAQRMGQTPLSFDDYQTRDANRKRSVTNNIIGGSGMDAKQTQNFLRITDKYQADPLVMAAAKGATARQIADQVIANPNDATNQLKALYVLVKNLDPDSAVREGEISLANQTQSYLQQFNTTLTRINTGQVISPDVAKQLAEATKGLAETWDATAQRRTKQYTSQANVTGVGDAFQQYLGGFDEIGGTGNSVIQDEAKAETSITNWVAQSPENRQRLIDLKQILPDASLSENLAVSAPLPMYSPS